MYIKGSIQFAPNIKEITGGITNPNQLLQSTLYNWQIANGNAASQIDAMFTVEQSALASSSSDSLDLKSLTDFQGNALDFAAIKAIILVPDAANSASVTLQGNFATVFLAGTTPGVIVNPGGIQFISDETTGYAVTMTTADTLDVLNDSGSETAAYTLILLGTKV